jgi:OmpA-OmpF porin, OOP family
MKRIAMLALIAILFSVATATAYTTDCECTLPCCSCPQPIVKDVPPPPPPPIPVKERAAVSLNILFDFDKAVVKEKYYEDVKKIADLMQEFPDKNITIEGHTDSFGTNEYNQKLSEERAKSVRQYLIDKFGINGSRLTAVGYGEEKPIASNDTPEGRQKNRRVEAVLEAVRIK